MTLGYVKPITIERDDDREPEPVPLDRLAEFQAALARSRLEAATIPETDRNDHGGYSYSSAEAVFSGTTKPLAAHGLSFRPVRRELRSTNEAVIVDTVYELSGYGVREESRFPMPIGESKKPFQNRYLVACTVSDREAVARLLGVARKGEPNPEDTELSRAEAEAVPRTRSGSRSVSREVKNLAHKMSGARARPKADPTDHRLSPDKAAGAELSELSKKYGKEFCYRWTEGLPRRGAKAKEQMIVAIKAGVSFGLGPDPQKPGPYTLEQYWDLLAGLQKQSPEEADACTLENLFGDIDVPWESLSPEQTTEACIEVRRRMILCKMKEETE